MSQNVQVTAVKAREVPAVATPVTSQPEVAKAQAVEKKAPVAVKDSMGEKVAKVGAERAKLSPLQAPKATNVVRGSSRVATEPEDLLWAAAMGAIWADILSDGY